VKRAYLILYYKFLEHF